VKRLVFFSTIAVYGQSASQVFDEGSPPQPDSFYARSKLEGERIVLEAKRHDGEALGAVLRMSAVYGTRIKGNYRRLLESLARKIFVPLGDGRNRRTLIYDRDAARAALLAARHPAAAGKIYNVTDGQYHSVEEIIRVICTSLGRNVPRVRLPVAPARRAVGILEDLARTTGIKLPIGRTTIDKYMEDLAVSGERIQRELGFQAEFDLVRGWAETILERRQAGKLGYYNSDSDRPR
jgi:UDP-glucose 4-epimerase